MPVSTKAAAVAATAAVVALIGGGLYFVLGKQTDDRFAQCRLGMGSGGTAIGGPFTMLSETGATVTERDVIDRPSLVYFGYTYCPDVCPVDSTRNAATADMLAEMGYDVNTVLISVDAARDTPETLRDFTDLMSPTMIGLTGTEAQIDAAVKAYRAYYRVQSPGDPNTLIDHSTQTYLMDPTFGFLDFYNRDVPPEEMAKSVACFLDVLKTNEK